MYMFINKASQEGSREMYFKGKNKLNEDQFLPLRWSKLQIATNKTLKTTETVGVVVDAIAH